MTRVPAPAPVPAPVPDIGLHVDRLTVEGVGEATARRLGTAFERRLGALLQERGLPRALAGDGIDLPSLDVELPSSELDPDRRGPERAGARLAEALWQRLDRPEKKRPRGIER